MPTVMRREGWRFFFYSDEHEPKHIHAEKGDAYIRIELDLAEVTDCYRVSPREIKKVLRIVEQEKEYIEKAWDEYFTEE